MIGDDILQIPFAPPQDGSDALSTSQITLTAPPKVFRPFCEHSWVPVNTPVFVRIFKEAIEAGMKVSECINCDLIQTERPVWSAVIPSWKALDNKKVPEVTLEVPQTGPELFQYLNNHIATYLRDFRKSHGLPDPHSTPY